MVSDAAVHAQMTYDAVDRAAHQAGLIVMGACSPRQQDPKGGTGTLILLGAGPAFWPVFTGSPESQDQRPNPVDRWSKRIIGAIAVDLGANTSFPSDGPPFAPFIQWALATGRFHTSPVGMMVHDTVGLMISIRGALMFDAAFPLPAVTQGSPCAACDAPCVAACPVGALSISNGYDVDACRAFLNGADGHSCMSRGCAARRACPVSAGAERQDAQSAFHMKAFNPS